MKKKNSSGDANKSNQRLGAVLISLMVALFIVGVFAAYRVLTLPTEQRTLKLKRKGLKKKG